MYRRRLRVPTSAPRECLGWKTLFGIALGLGVGCASSAPKASDELIELVSFLGDVYPGPPVDADLESIVRTEAASLDEDPDERRSAAAIHRTLAFWNDAHVFAGLPASVTTQPVSIVPLLPVRVGERILVDASAPAVPLGTEIVALEGRPIASFLTDLERYVSVDGGSSDVRAALAERDFARLTYLELGMLGAYSVTLRRPDGVVESRTHPGLGGEDAVTLEQTRRSLPRRGPSNPEGTTWPFSVELDPNTRLLRLPTFGIDDVEGYRARIDAIFADLRGDETLVLDVRGNAGGIRLHGVAVLRHLIDRDFVQWTRVQTRVRAIPRRYRERVAFLVGSEAAFDNLPWQKDDGRWSFDGDPWASAMTPNSPVHRGAVVVFVDDATHSAAVEMVVALLAFRPATRVVGTETRGGCARHTGELPVVFTTPESAVPALVSLFEITLVSYGGCTPGRGVQPDIAVAYDEASFAAGNDPYLDALVHALQ